MQIYKSKIKAFILFVIFIISLSIFSILIISFKQKTGTIYVLSTLPTPTHEIIKGNIRKIPYYTPLPIVIHSKTLISIANVISNLLNTSPKYDPNRQDVEISVSIEDKTIQLETIDHVINVMKNEGYIYLGKNDVAFGNEDTGTCKRETTCDHFFQKDDISCVVKANFDYSFLIVQCSQQ